MSDNLPALDPQALQAGAAADHKTAKALAVAVLSGGDPLICARSAFEALEARNRELAGGDVRSSAAIREALADQVALLELTVAAFTVKAAQARNSDKARQLQGVALKASQTLTQALMALHRTTEDARTLDA